MKSKTYTQSKWPSDKIKAQNFASQVLAKTLSKSDENKEVIFFNQRGTFSYKHEDETVPSFFKYI